MCPGNAGCGLGHQAWAVEKRSKAVKGAELKQAVGLDPGSRWGSDALNLDLWRTATTGRESITVNPAHRRKYNNPKCTDTTRDGTV